MNVLDRLGLAIANAGYTWTPEMRQAYEEGIKELEAEALAEQAEQEPFDMDDHPPHRLCECRKCMEYFTPLPDCDAFAAPGKPIAEQTNTQLMEGYRIGLAEMREKCAKVVTEHAPTTSPHWVSYVAAIRAIKFEGDTGFRPVSEMIAEQEPVAWMGLHKELGKLRWMGGDEGWDNAINAVRDRLVELYTAPVRTKDLTDAFINELHKDAQDPISFARAVIAADREKNRG